MLPDISHDRPDDGDLDAPATGKQLARQQAIRQIERRRRFRMRATIGTLLMTVLTVSWVFAEYHNAGGWPSHGFSQSNRGQLKLHSAFAERNRRRSERRPARGPWPMRASTRNGRGCTRRCARSATGSS